MLRADEAVGIERHRRAAVPLAAGLTVAATLWAALILLLPSAVPRADAPTVHMLVHAAGAAVCHQRPERSFSPGGERLAVCARCTALYVTGAFGALLGWFGAARVPRRVRTLLAAAALPTLLTVGLELVGAAAPPNAVRAASAVPLGAFAGWLFVRLLRTDGPGVQMGYHSKV